MELGNQGFRNGEAGQHIVKPRDFGEVFHRIPDHIGAGCPFSVGLGEHFDQHFPLIDALEWRIDQRGPAPLERRDLLDQRGVTIGRANQNLLIAFEQMSQNTPVLRMQFRHDQPVLRAQKMPGDQGRTGVEAIAAAGVHRGDHLPPRRENGRFLSLQDGGHATLPLQGFTRLNP